jgi:hypothetical protein
MPDISMCNKEDCPSYTSCYRAQAIPSEYQQDFFPYDNEGAEYCEHYIEIEGDE